MNDPGPAISAHGASGAILLARATPTELDAALRRGATAIVASGDELEALLHMAERLGIVASCALLIATHRSSDEGFTPDAAINRLSRFTGVRALRFVGFTAPNVGQGGDELRTLLTRARNLGYATALIEIG